ncbi:MAG: DUF4249 domain-containing protein [Bacteroidota bacterium]|nr:DUF4249 domain-containing protein [Bacteroidota bacterium]
MKKTVYFFLLVLLVCSCEMVVKVDIPEHKPTLVLNSVIDPSEPFVAYITNSLGILDRGTIKNIDSASVEIYENDVLLEKLPFIGEGAYISNDKKPVSGRRYKIIVDAPPYQQIQATIEVPELVGISNIIYKESAYTDPNWGALSSITFTIHDPSSIKNYYSAGVISLDTFFFEPNSIYIHTNDPAIESADYGSDALLFSDEHFNGKDYTLEVLFSKLYYENREDYEIFLNIASVSKEHYLYKTSLTVHNQTANNPFAEPAPVYTNVKNGLGIFASKNSKFYLLPK